MAQDNIAIIYAATSGIPRRLIVPDDDNDLRFIHRPGPGEDMVIVPRDQVRRDAAGLPLLADIQAVTAQALGRAIPSGRCAVVDALGSVVNVIMADPTLDTVPDHTLMAHDQAVPGWTLVAGVLTAPIISIAPVAA